MAQTTDITDREAQWILGSIGDCPLEHVALSNLRMLRELVKKLQGKKVDKKYARKLLKRINTAQERSESEE